MGKDEANYSDDPEKKGGKKHKQRGERSHFHLFYTFIFNSLE